MSSGERHGSAHTAGTLVLATAAATPQQTGIDVGVEAVRDEGRQEGLKQGREQGREQGLERSVQQAREVLRTQLRSLGWTVPPTLDARITACTDLMRWLLQTSTTTDVESALR